MLWYKSWLETRWRFLIGLALLMCSAGAVVLIYPRVVELLPLVPATTNASGELGQRIREAAELSRDYRGYVWSQAFRQNLAQMITLFAVLLGTGGLLAEASGGAASFTLSMPVSRNRLLGIRAAAGLAELLMLALIPALLIPLLSPAVGETYGAGNALIHGLCLFVAGAVFFSLAVLLSTIFGDLWSPLLLTLIIAVAIGIWEQLARGVSSYSIFGVMSGETYFRAGHLPWAGLFVSAAVSAAMLFGASVNFSRRDF